MYVDIFGFSVHIGWIIFLAGVYLSYAWKKDLDDLHDKLTDDMNDLRTDLEDQIDDLDEHIGRLRQANNPLETPEYIYEEKIREIKKKAYEVTKEGIAQREKKEADKKEKYKEYTYYVSIFLLGFLIYYVIGILNR